MKAADRTKWPNSPAGSLRASGGKRRNPLSSGMLLPVLFAINSTLFHDNCQRIPA